MIGLLMTAFFRDVKNATLSLVVLFLVFILFSRLLIVDGDYMNPYCYRSAPDGNFGAKVPVYLSFACLSRYVANAVFLVFNFSSF